MIPGTIAAHEAIIDIKAKKKRQGEMGAMNERENKRKKEKTKSPKKRVIRRYEKLAI